MEIRKSKKANLENWRGTFFLVGVIVALGLVFYAFEYKSKDYRVEVFDGGTAVVDNQLIKITQREKPKPKPKPKPIYNQIKKVDNSTATDIPIDDLIPENWPDEFIFSLGDDTVEEVHFDPFFKFPEVAAVFPGNLQEYLVKNIEYPELAKQIDIQGIVYLKFRIDARGNVSNIEIVRGVHPIIDEEAIRVIENMPPWKPAVQGDRKVATELGLSIKFSLKR